MSQSPSQKPSGLNTEIVNYITSTPTLRDDLVFFLKEAGEGTIAHDLLKDGKGQKTAEEVADDLLALPEMQNPTTDNAEKLAAMEAKLGLILETRQRIEAVVPVRPAPVRPAPVRPASVRPEPVAVTPAPATPAPTPVAPEPAAP